MNYKINYGNGAFAVPSKITEIMGRANLSDIKVFLALCRLSSAEYDEDMIAAMSELPVEEVSDSLTFWRGAGLLEAPREKKTRTKAESKKTPAEVVPNEPKVIEKNEKNDIKLGRSDALPSYNSDELGRILEERAELAVLIDECQKLIGKMFSLHETNTIVGLVDYLGLEFDYILTLVAYCVKNDKKTLHYIEKTAFSLYNSGITDTAALSEELRRREEFSGVEGEIRKLFGIGSRVFTTKEKKMIASWVFDMKYSVDMIKQAYEVTADATGKSSLPYANTVLERWNSDGIRTPEDVEQDKVKRNSSSRDKNVMSSFNDVDEFFEAAVKRNLGEG